MLNYKDMKFEDILNWCEENGELDWLEEEASRLVEVEVYPTKVVTNPDGSTKRVPDKSQTPSIEKREISYIQIKNDFVNRFMPEIAPKKKATEKESMLDKIRARKAAQ